MHMSSRKMRSARAAFTLTELLVVLAIVTVVMALLVVQYLGNAQRDRANDAIRTLQAAVIGARGKAVTLREPVVLVIAHTVRAADPAADYPGDTMPRFWVYCLTQHDADNTVTDIYDLRDTAGLVPALLDPPMLIPDHVNVMIRNTAPPPTWMNATGTRVTFRADGSIDSNTTNTPRTHFLVEDAKHDDIASAVRILRSTGEMIVTMDLKP